MLGYSQSVPACAVPCGCVERLPARDMWYPASVIALENQSAEAQNRTGDTRIFSPLLYRLSYLGMGFIVDFPSFAVKENGFGFMSGRQALSGGRRRRTGGTPPGDNSGW